MQKLEEKQNRYRTLIDLDQRLTEDALMLEEAGIVHSGIKRRLSDLRRELRQHMRSQSYSIKKGKLHAHHQSTRP